MWMKARQCDLGQAPARGRKRPSRCRSRPLRAPTFAHGGAGRTAPARIAPQGAAARPIALLLLGLLAGTAAAQVNVDSLWAVWHNQRQADTARMQALDYLAFDHYLFHDPDSAYQLAEKMVGIAERTGNLKYQAVGWNEQGASLQLRGDIPGALERYQRSLDVLKEMGDARRLGLIYGNIGAIHRDLGGNRLALAYCDSSLTSCTAAGDTTCIGNAELNMGIALLALKDTGHAYQRFATAARLHELSGNARSLALSLGNLGMLDRVAGRRELAAERITEAISIAEQLGDERQLAAQLRSLAMLQAGQGRLKEAIGTARRSLSVAQGSNMASEVFEAAGTLHQLYKQSGDLPKALAMHELYAVMMDSLHNQKGREEMIKAGLRHQFRQRLLTDSLQHQALLAESRAAQQLAEVKADSQRRAMAWGLLAVLLIAGTGVAAILDRRKRQARHAREQALALERMRIASDMHDDLGAGLSALKLRSEIAVRDEKDPQVRNLLAELAETSHGLITNMRQIIWTMQEEERSLADLLAYLGNYAKEYLGQHGLALDLRQPEHLPDVVVSPRQRREVLLTVKEALHNIVKHARATSVSVTMEAGRALSITVQDDGVGMPSETDRPPGNGLLNMQRRMQAVGGSATFEAPDGAGGTRAVFRMPFQAATDPET